MYPLLQSFLPPTQLFGRHYERWKDGVPPRQRFSLVELRKVFSNDSFIVGIEGIGGFVQEYEHRILIDYSRNKYALPLP